MKKIYFTAKRFAFCRKAFCNLRQNGMHYAAKRSALCRIMQWRFAAKWSTICRKMPYRNAGLRQKNNKKGTKTTFFGEKVQNLKEMSYICTFFRLHAKQWQL